MTTFWRKLLVVGVIAVVLGVAGVYEIANWLARHGLVETAATARDQYLDGTSIAIIVALLILLGSQRR
jgi:hypothetical protein